MKPDLITGLDHVNASYQSIRGMIKSNWSKSNTGFEWDITIPANTTAIAYIPAKEVKDLAESGKPLSAAEGVQLITIENGRAIVQIGSGEYHFVSKM